jgi:hypothetical protein
VGSYVGPVTVRVGLYARDGSRVPLAGLNAGRRDYVVARLQLVPQSEGVRFDYNDGWHQAEATDGHGAGGWRWTGRQATLTVRNPKTASTLYLELDNPGGLFSDPQQVTVLLGATTLDRFEITPRQQPLLRRVLIPTEAWGTDDRVDVRIAVDKTFVPNLLLSSAGDSRELGVRLFHVAVVPANYQ